MAQWTSEGNQKRHGLSMCAGVMLRQRHQRMLVRAKWVRYAPSRVAPQELSCPSSICYGAGFLFVPKTLPPSLREVAEQREVGGSVLM